MTPILFEQPWLLGSVGTVITIVTLYGWTQSGNSIALKLGAAFGLVTILLLALNLWVVTDAEKIRTWLSDAADELENNQFDKLIKRISSNHSIRVANTVDRMKTVKFSVAQVTKIHGIEIDPTGESPTAIVRMNAFVRVERDRMSAKVPRWVALTLEKKGDEWYMIDFEDRDPQFEFINSGSLSETIGSTLQGAR